MRKILSCVAAALLLGTPSAYSAEIEKPAAIDGSAYSVIPSVLYNVTTANGRTDSYIRLFNGGLSTARFDLIIVNPATGATVGSTFSINVPSHASVQYQIQDLFGASYANVSVTGTAAYFVYVKSSEPTAGYQHAYFNDGTKFFENATTCATLLNQTMLAATNTIVLTNLSSSLLTNGTNLNYPTSVVIHNYSSTAATYRLVGVNARTGEPLGSIEKTVQANQTFSAPFFNPANATTLAASLQNQFGWNPIVSGTIYESWANLFVTDITGAVPQATVTHSIGNSTLGGSFPMTTACALNAPVSTSLSASTTFEGAIAGAGGQSGTFSILVATSGSTAAAPEGMQSAKATVEKQQATLTATGSLRLTSSSTPITLSGSYDTVTRKLTVTGGSYTFTGGVAAGSTYSGTYTGPSGAVGGFAGDKASATVKTRGYCGTFTGTDDEGAIGGTFNFVVSGTGALSGSISQSDGSAARLTGSASGTSVSGNVTGPETAASFSGILGTSSASGNFTGHEASGTWMGSSCGSF